MEPDEVSIGVSLGDWVLFSRPLRRFAVHERRERETPSGLPRVTFDRVKRWEPDPTWRGPSGDWTEGVVVGIRTLADGETILDYEAGYQWVPGTATRHTALLIAWHLRRKPVLVSPNCVRRKRP